MSTATEEKLKIEPQPAPEKLPPQEVINEFFADRLNNKPGTKKEPETPETPPVKPAKKPEVKKPAAKKPVVTPEPVAAPDYEAIATAAGRGVAEAMRTKEPEKTEPADETGFLTEEERERLPILDRMESMKPDRYKGLRGKYIANLKEIESYQKAWERENPGDVFDPEDKAHNDFYAKHTLDWNELDERKAIADIVADSRVKEVEGRTNAELKELRTREKSRELEPSILAESLNADRKVFELIGGEFPNLLTKEGALDATVFAALQEKDPLALEIVTPEVLNIRRHCAEMLKLEREAVEFDPKNPMHNFLAGYASRQEAEILALAKADQVTDGKKFATSEQWGAMTEKERAKHWRLTASDLNTIFATEFGQKLADRLEMERKRIERFAPKYGYTKGQSGNEPPPKPAVKPEDEEAEEITSPETTGVVITTPAAKSGQHTPKNGTGAFFDKNW